MISFPENYFNTETRCRFTIGKLMKSNWAAQLEVLEVLKEICSKHDIGFFAGFGTLIGAVRHKGFIPWDDDIDVTMKRSDYMRFLSVARQELPPQYCILSVYHEEEWNNSFSRVTNGNVISVERAYLEQNHGCPFCVGVDIFPIDYYPPTHEERKLQWAMLEMVKENIGCCDELLSLTDPEGQEAENCREALTQGLEALHEYLGVSVDKNRSILNIRNQLFRLYDQVCMMYRAEECEEMVSFQANLTHTAGQWKKEWFERAIPMGYDVVWIPVPIAYDKVLRATFGDYRSPQYWGGGHDYPYYKPQLEQLLERGLWTLEDGLEAGEYQELPPWEQVRENGLSSPMPQEWQELLQSGTEKKADRKTILYATSLMGLLRGEEKYLKKIRSVLDTFRQQQDVVLWWIPCETENCLYRAYNPALFDHFEKLCREYKDGAWGIYDDSGDYARAVVHTDAMYGDYGEIFELYRQSGKPIMIQDETV